MSEERKNYVAGFLFDEALERVVLIKKDKPEWQRGKFNGVGGKIEVKSYPTGNMYNVELVPFEETSLEAMQREFKEETGLHVKDWKQFCYLQWLDGSVTFFAARGDVDSCHTVEKELISVLDIRQILQNDSFPLIPNLRWLIPLALDKNGSTAVVTL